jgi:hypothetical protein
MVQIVFGIIMVFIRKIVVSFSLQLLSQYGFEDFYHFESTTAVFQTYTTG